MTRPILLIPAKSEKANQEGIFWGYIAFPDSLRVSLQAHLLRGHVVPHDRRYPNPNPLLVDLRLVELKVGLSSATVLHLLSAPSPRPAERSRRAYRILENLHLAYSQNAICVSSCPAGGTRCSYAASPICPVRCNISLSPHADFQYNHALCPNMSLCEYCGKIPAKLFSFRRNEQSDYDHQPTISALKASAGGGCQGCRLLLHAIESSESEHAGKYALPRTWNPDDRVRLSSTKFGWQIVRVGWTDAGHFRGFAVPLDWSMRLQAGFDD